VHLTQGVRDGILNVVSDTKRRLTNEKLKFGFHFLPRTQYFSYNVSIPSSWEKVVVKAKFQFFIC